jgi:tetratricopeptide (TPR) repeat protein
MGFRVRKSIKIAPGIRMNVGKSGIGYSAGVRGARVSRSATGRVTRTLSLPGTGLSHSQTLSGSRSRSTPSRSGSTRLGAPAPVAPPKPGMLASAAEKALFKAVVAGTPDPSALPKIGREHSDYRVLAAAMEGFLQLQVGNNTRARELLAWVFAQRQELAGHEFVRKYLAAMTITVEVAPAISVELPFGMSTVALAVAELHQDAGDLDVAIETVERIDPPTTIAALSLAELYVAAARHGDVVDVTNQITNVDDATALLCVFRGVALRETGFADAAREAFKEALKSKSRTAAIRHRAYIERALTYMAQNKNAMARKHLERVLAEDASAPGIAEALAQLPG